MLSTIFLLSFLFAWQTSLDALHLYFILKLFTVSALIKLLGRVFHGLITRCEKNLWRASSRLWCRTIDLLCLPGLTRIFSWCLCQSSQLSIHLLVLLVMP